MARVRGLTETGPRLYRLWHRTPGLFDQVRATLDYSPGGRACATLVAVPDGPWPAPLTDAGPELLDRLTISTRTRYTLAVAQGYRDGAAHTGWHTDDGYDCQAILSLGATRVVRCRAADVEVDVAMNDGDLLVMPSGFQDEWQHCVPVSPALTGERCSLVFRTPKVASCTSS